jgi:uncharacterized protein (TIGR02117 family)
MKLRRLRKALLGSFLLLVGTPGLYFTAGWGLSWIPVNRDFVEPAAGIEIFLVSNGIHVDFLLPVSTPVKDWSREVPREHFSGVDAHWSHLLLGWGDRGFYLETPTWADVKLRNVARALFWPDASVMHVQYVDGRPDLAPDCRALRLSEEAYRRLCRYLEDSFARDAAGAVVLIRGRGYRPSDNFYEGRGSYHAFNTCNNWTNRGLKAAGARTALWSPFSGGLLRHLP